MPNTVWDSLPSYAQPFLSPYGNIESLLKEMPMPASPEANQAAATLQRALTGTFGINDAVARPLNDALADPKARAAVIKASQDHPDELTSMANAIAQNPESAGSLVARIEQQEAAPQSPTRVAGNNSPQPAPGAAQPSAPSVSQPSGGDDGTAQTASNTGITPSRGPSVSAGGDGNSGMKMIMGIFALVAALFDGGGIGGILLAAASLFGLAGGGSDDKSPGNDNGTSSPTRVASTTAARDNAATVAQNVQGLVTPTPDYVSPNPLPGVKSQPQQPQRTA